MPTPNLGDYRVTPAAQKDLADIWLYTAQQWSLEQAERYVDILEDSFAQLLFMPENGTRAPGVYPTSAHPSRCKALNHL